MWRSTAIFRENAGLLVIEYKHSASMNPIMDTWYGTLFSNGFVFCDTV